MLEHLLRSDDLAVLREALVSAALFEADLRWVEERSLELRSHRDPSVRCVAATCLGRLARIHGDVDVARVLPRLHALQQDPETAGSAETANTR
jgi:hypothetical protein